MVLFWGYVICSRLRKDVVVSLYDWLTILVPGSVGVATVVVMVVALIRQERGKREDRMD